MDYNKLAALEHEIAKKYGKDIVEHPRANWDEHDEEEYVRQTTEMHKKLDKLLSDKNYTNKKGYLVSKKLLNEDTNVNKNCPYCNKYHFRFNLEDDVNMNKFGCCRDCFYNYIEGREKRWINGWRPTETDN